MTGNNQTEETVAIINDDRTNRAIIVRVSGRALYLSAKPPRISIKVADENVPIAYIAPQIEWLILK